MCWDPLIHFILSSVLTGYAFPDTAVVDDMFYTP
jgi:hypothetical protein